jgi:hypothetical protein
METIVVKVKSDTAAQMLADFLGTIEYIENVERKEDVEQSLDTPQSFIKGSYLSHEKPSDFAGIWKNRKKIDANQLRKKAWQRKK